MKVKVIKLDDRYDNHSQQEKENIGKVYEALKFKDGLYQNQMTKNLFAIMRICVQVREMI